MITIVDYGMGNLHSVFKAFEAVGAPVQISSQPGQIDSSDKIVLPGVGAFADAMAALRDRRLADPLLEFLKAGKPFLGICLGMQLLLEVSYEDGRHEGLGVIAGDVRRFDFSGRQEYRHLKIPHIGWNRLDWQGEPPLFKGLRSGCYVYFVHSYYVAPQEPSLIASTTDYGGPFASAIRQNNILAVQFHPEKSQRTGLQMLKNFAEL